MELKEKRKVSEGGERAEMQGLSAERGKEDEGRKGRVRRATFDDFDAIMDINDNIYTGLDYMPALFYTFMHSKLHVIYVHEEDGKLVSLVNVRFYPECSDLVALMSGRVRPSHQGRGLGASDSTPIKVQIVKEHAQLKRYIGDTLYKPNIAAKADKWKVLYNWNLLLYKLTDRIRLNRFTHIHQMAPDPTQPFRLSYTSATEWLEHSDELVRFVSKFANDLFPLGRTWTPTPISRSGLRDMFSVANVMVSFNPDVTSAIHERSFPDVILSTEHSRIKDSGSQRTGDRGQADEVVGLSYSTGLPCKYGFAIDINFFGDCENLFLSHIYSHLSHYVNMTSDDVRLGIFLHFPMSISLKNVEERLNKAMGERLEDDFYTVTQVVSYIRNLPVAKL